MPSETEDDQKLASSTKQLQHMMTGQSELLTRISSDIRTKNTLDDTHYWNYQTLIFISNIIFLTIDIFPTIINALNNYINTMAILSPPQGF